ncbi:MAG: MATE family efflux transporter [Clostridium sp.]|uniref:MATE family efflux transporter n=1 Tax=Clostridium sp. TaxID=1506 RepID=UPI003EE70C4D
MSLELKKKLKKITWPILVEMILMSLLGSIDVFMLGKYSDNAVAVVGIINQIVWMINLAFCITTAGTSILLTQYLGFKKSEEDVIQICGISIGLNFLLGLILSICLVSGSTGLFRLLNTPLELITLGNGYMQIIVGFSFVIAIMMTFTAILRAHELTKICMKITLLMNGINIIGNYLLIFGKFGFPELGVTGAAIATTFSRIVALIILGYKVYKLVLHKITREIIKNFSKEHFKNIVKIGIPTVSEQFSYNITQLIITSFINTMAISSIATKGYINNIVFLSFMFSAAVGQGASIVIGQLIGEGKEEKAYEVYKYSIKISMIITVISSLVLVVLGKAILGFFTSNEEILSLGIILLAVDVLLEPGRAMNLVGINGIRATGDVKYPVYIAIFSMWIFAVGLAYVLGVYLKLGLVGVWIAFAVDEWVRGILIYKRWKSGKWKSKAFVRCLQEA